MIARNWSAEQYNCAKSLFGRALRLQLADWILSRDRREFFLGEAQQEMAVLHASASSAVRAELLTFCEWGLLDSEPRGGRLYFEHIDSDLWPALKSAVDAVMAEW